MLAEGTGRGAEEADPSLNDHFYPKAFFIETKAWHDYLMAVGFVEPNRTPSMKEGGTK